MFSTQCCCILWSHCCKFKTIAINMSYDLILRVRIFAFFGGIEILSVPYRGAPRYNSKRRLSSTLGRRRSFSQSSVGSSTSGDPAYRNPSTLANNYNNTGNSNNNYHSSRMSHNSAAPSGVGPKMVQSGPRIAHQNNGSHLVHQQPQVDFNWNFQLLSRMSHRKEIAETYLMKEQYWISMGSLRLRLLQAILVTCTWHWWSLIGILLAGFTPSASSCAESEFESDVGDDGADAAKDHSQIRESPRFQRLFWHFARQEIYARFCGRPE